tara:strand:- start:58 stop:1194 length:1137 start_codon:yes stop_codon:yes gene_type:complete
MPNFPPNYAEQEKFFASKEYQTGAKEAIKKNQPLPKYEAPKSESNITTKGQRSAKSKRRGGVLRYPLEALTGTTDYLQIDILEYKRPKNQLTRPAGFGTNTLNRASGRTTSGSLARKSVVNDGSILLQVPSNVQDGNAVNFGDSSMNTLVGAAAGMIGNVMTKGGDELAKLNKQGLSETLGNFGKGVKDDFTDRFKNSQGLGQAAQDFMNAKLTSSALGVFGGNVSAQDLLARQTGQIFNPNLELLFDAPTLRSFTFSFKMTPRSEQEAKQCKLIIRSFKQNMAPKANTESGIDGTGIFLKTPNIFELRYRKGNRDHPFLHKFKQCFLTNFSVNYTAEGTHTTYDDATPVSMQMDMTFKEIEPIYDVDYKDSDNSVGF